MSTSYVPYHPEQQQLLPPALQDWLPQGHLAYFISDTVDSLDLSAFHARYARGGPRNQPLHPAMMVKVLVYAYATGVFSSRKIAKKLHEDIAFRVLGAHNFPAHRTIRDFRAQHLVEFTELFRQARLAAIVAAKARLQERQAQADTQRGRSQGDERKPKGKDGKPKGGRPYKRDFGIPEPKAQSSFTDPDSRIMKRAGGGFDYSYNAQTAVDESHHIIVAAEVVNSSTDVQQLPMVLDAVQTHTGVQPRQVLADAGYRSEAVMAKLAQTHPDTELVIALGREGKARAAPKDAKRYPHTVAMAAKLQTEQGQGDYRKRKWIAEPPNGWIKNVLGFRQFSMRGLEKAKAEFKLVCMALNLRRMGAMRAA